MMKTILTTSIVAALLSASAHAVTTIRVSVETTGPVGLAPGIAGFSNGSFDIFDVGSAASEALETLAETGAPSGFGPFTGAVQPIFGPGVSPTSPPIFGPNGASSFADFTVGDGDNMFNFAAMLLPSNDWFIGNSNSFDVGSLLNAAIGTTTSFDFTNVYDAGTEEEDFNFSPGNGLIGVTTMGDGGPDSGVDQNGVVSLLSFTDAPFANYAGAQQGFDGSTAGDFRGGPIARVTLTVVPEPSTSVLAGLGVLGLIVRRRR